jgi:signal transduction histidine kinase/sensor domain CHASE-containing protein
MTKISKSRIFFKDIFSYFLVGFAISFVALFFTAYYSYVTIYNTAVNESSAAIAGAISTEQKKMSSIAESYGVWEQTYTHVMTNFDQKWIEDDIVEDLKRDFSVPYVGIYKNDSNYSIVYSNYDELGQQGKTAPAFAADQLAAFKASAGKSAAKSFFTKNGDTTFVVSVSKISLPEQSSIAGYLVIAKPVTSEYLSQLATDYSVASLKLVSDPSSFSVGSQPSLTIKEKDKVLSYIVWSANDSASSVLKVLIPMGFVVILVLIFIGFMITRKIVSANMGYTQVLEELSESTKELKQAKEKSDASSEAKTKFLSMMSHEIKTPMNGLMGMISLLKDTELNTTQSEYVNTMQHSTESLLKLVDNILEFSKLESGEVSTVYSTFNIREMVSEVHGLLYPISIQKKLKFEVSFDDSVPLTMRSDAIRIRQVLLHLITNALKFTKVGSVKINIGGTDIGQNKYDLIIQVADTGIGIPDGIKETLFQDFFQVDGNKNRSQDGAGLGLSIVKNIVAMLGAKIGIESKLGQGSMFWVQLEVETVSKLAGAGDNASPSHVEIPTAAPVTADHKLDILLVEEEMPEGSLTFNLLERNGSQVETVSNVAIAADLIASKSYDAILISIPENSDLHGDFSPTLIKAAMQGRIPTPIMGISKEDASDVDLSHFDHIISSPLTSAKLSTALQDMIRSTQTH